MVRSSINFTSIIYFTKTGEAENITTHYIFALGIYRALYIPNWIYRYFAEGHFDFVSVLAGLLQTGIYSDFFLYLHQSDER